MVFDSEKKYYEAAQEVQVVSLSRFLNHQSVERNKFANELIEAFTFNNIVSEILYVEKNKQHLNRHNLKNHLQHTKYIPLVCRCLDFDQDIIEECAILLRNQKLPIDILEVATRLMTFLIFQGISGSHQIIEELKEVHSEKKEIRAVQFRNNL